MEREALVPVLRNLVALFVLMQGTVMAQRENYIQHTYTPPPGKGYVTNGGEWLLSVPVLAVNGSDRGAIVRFAPVINIQSMLNYDFSVHAGLFVGLSLRNVGFIHDAPDGDRFKYRTYNAGVPVGIKLGRMHGTLFFAGYEFELPFNYKEKRFANEQKKEKFVVWFSKRNAPCFQSVFVGLQGPAGTTVSLRYYLSNFHNKDYVEWIDGVQEKPYAGLNSNVVLVSLGFGLFDGERSSWERKPQDVQVRR